MNSTTRRTLLAEVAIVALLLCHLAGPAAAGDYDGIGGYGMPSKLTEPGDEEGISGYTLAKPREQKGEEEGINGNRVRGTTTVGAGDYPFWPPFSWLKALDLNLATWMALLRAR